MKVGIYIVMAMMIIYMILCFVSLAYVKHKQIYQ